jgi:hypothetical protein
MLILWVTLGMLILWVTLGMLILWGDAGYVNTLLGNDQLDALFLNVFSLCLYVFRAASAHYQEVQIVLIHHLV